MRQVIIDSPKQLAEGLSIAAHITTSGKQYTNVVICGMGGSALPADVLLTIITPHVPVYIHRDYDLPPAIGKQSLVICISYSGNTEETLSAMQQALNLGCDVVGMTSGGAIETMCQDKNLPLVKIPSGIQPRMATGYMFAALTLILAKQQIIDDISKEITDSQTYLEQTIVSLEASGKVLAQKLKDKIPVIYGSATLKAAAHIFKIKFNENSKTPAFDNYFPELNHNEMVGYTNTKDKSLSIIILRDNSDHPRNQKRMALFAKQMTGIVPVEIIDLGGDSMTEKVFWTLALGDWTSYYLALANSIDPTPVAMVEEFKRGLDQ